jgi:pectin methylesterase-like acyl-CoA thioesterase
VGLAVLVTVALGASVLAQEPCTISVQPWKSIQRAIDAAPEGAVICLTEGERKEGLEISKSLTLRGLGPERSVVWGGITISTPEKIQVRIEGLKITQ